MKEQTLELLRLGLMLGDFGFSKFIEISKMMESTGTTIPQLEEIRADIEKKQPRADAIEKELDEY